MGRTHSQHDIQDDGEEDGDPESAEVGMTACQRCPAKTMPPSANDRTARQKTRALNSCAVSPGTSERYSRRSPFSASTAPRLLARPTSLADGPPCAIKSAIARGTDSDRATERAALLFALIHCHPRSS